MWKSERSEYKRGIQVPAGWTNKIVVGGGQVQHHTAHGPPSELLSPPSDKYHITLRSGAKQRQTCCHSLMRINAELNNPTFC